MTQAELLELLRARAEQGSGASLGIMGGTFDPPHAGHLALARVARERLGLDAVLFIPAGIPSFKRDKQVTPARHRLAMLELALQDVPYAALSSMEVRREGVTYTADTLEELRGLCPEGTRLVFIMGGDSLHTLPHWDRAGRILELAEIAAVARVGCDLAQDEAQVLERYPQARIHVICDEGVPDISSTRLRAELEGGRTAGEFLDASVLRYIRAEGLYTS